MTLHDKYEAAPRRAYEGAVTDLGDGGTDLRVALLDINHEPNLTGHAAWSDVSADEITNTASNDTGYAAGGMALSTVTWASDGTGVTQLSAGEITWETSTIDAGYAVVYDNTPATASDKTLLTLVDFEGEESSEDGDFTIDWDAVNGIFQINTSP